jgi:hypothetical protein
MMGLGSTSDDSLACYPSYVSRATDSGNVGFAFENGYGAPGQRSCMNRIVTTDALMNFLPFCPLARTATILSLRARATMTSRDSLSASYRASSCVVRPNN